MKRAFKIFILVLLILAVIAVVGYLIGSFNVPVLNPKGIIAQKQRDLIITATSLMLIVVIPVFIFTIFFAWKYREENKDAKYSPDWAHSNLAEFIWWGVPFAIITVLGILTYITTHDLNPFKPIVSDKKALPIQVVALEWKWLFIYPEQGVATINFVQFPENRPVEFEITADAPMNSFWIPQLGGQIYAMPAMRTKLYLMAHEVGDYRGSSSNFSGTGFAGMSFTARASSQRDFDSWAKNARRSSTLTKSVYETLVQPSEYHPVETYRLGDSDLFDHIIMKYMAPTKQMGH